ncbi:MAG: hypothetical protein GXX79_21710 [Actinomycetales bacterium]|nr:hypothetical protein [Actinomycetales bacterium]
MSRSPYLPADLPWTSVRLARTASRVPLSAGVITQDVGMQILMPFPVPPVPAPLAVRRRFTARQVTR